MDSNSITIRDVAARAGVSPGTASRALRGHPQISETCIARVREAANALAYRPLRDRSGRRHKEPLAGKKIAVVLLGIDRSLASLPAVAEAIHGAEEALAEVGAHPMLINVPDPAEPPRSLRRVLFDGILAKAALQGAVVDALGSKLRSVLESNALVWMLGRPFGAKGDAVGPDNPAMGRLAAETLVAAGHTVRSPSSIRRPTTRCSRNATRPSRRPPARRGPRWPCTPAATTRSASSRWSRSWRSPTCSRSSTPCCGIAPGPRRSSAPPTASPPSSTGHWRRAACSLAATCRSSPATTSAAPARRTLASARDHRRASPPHRPSGRAAAHPADHRGVRRRGRRDQRHPHAHSRRLVGAAIAVASRPPADPAIRPFVNPFDRLPSFHPGAVSHDHVSHAAAQRTTASRQPLGSVAHPGPGAACIRPRSAPSTTMSRSTKRGCGRTSPRWRRYRASTASSATGTPARSCRCGPRSGPSVMRVVAEAVREANARRAAP